MFFHCKNTGGNIPLLLVDLMNVSSPSEIYVMVFISILCGMFLYILCVGRGGGGVFP